MMRYSILSPQNLERNPLLHLGGTVLKGRRDATSAKQIEWPITDKEDSPCTWRREPGRSSPGETGPKRWIPI